jgi:hypothetical protein
MKLKSDEDENQPDAAWKEFIEVLWEYQYLKNPAKLSDNILDDPSVMTLYNLSQGIPAIALTLFVLAQNRAILSQTETLTTAIFNSAERDRLNLIRHGIDQIRLGREISYGDISDIDSTFWIGRKRAKTALNLNNKSEANKTESDNNADSDESLSITEDMTLKGISKKELSSKSTEDSRFVPKDKKLKAKNNDFSDVQQSVKNAAEFLDL